MILFSAKFQMRTHWGAKRSYLTSGPEARIYAFSTSPLSTSVLTSWSIKSSQSSPDRLLFHSFSHFIIIFGIATTPNMIISSLWTNLEKKIAAKSIIDRQLALLNLNTGRNSALWKCKKHYKSTCLLQTVDPNFQSLPAINSISSSDSLSDSRPLSRPHFASV